MYHFNLKHLPYTCTQMFSLVADVESYPAFLPGWSSVRLLQADESRLQVEQRLQIGLLDLRFQSTARLEPCSRILITSSDAPFRAMKIDWRFTPQPGNHCDVSVAITLALQAGFLNRPLEQLLGHSGDQLLQLFEKRARSLYAGP